MRKSVHVVVYSNWDVKLTADASSKIWQVLIILEIMQLENMDPVANLEVTY